MAKSNGKRECFAFIRKVNRVRFKVWEMSRPDMAVDEQAASLRRPAFPVFWHGQRRG